MCRSSRAYPRERLTPTPKSPLPSLPSLPLDGQKRLQAAPRLKGSADPQRKRVLPSNRKSKGAKKALKIVGSL